MATVKYLLKGTKNDKLSLYVRMQQSKMFDFEKSLKIYTDKKNFDVKNQRFKCLITSQYHEEYNRLLADLKEHLYKMYNNDFIQGKLFNRHWFENIINDFFNLQNHNDKENWKLYISDFGKYWLECLSKNYLTSSNKPIAKTTYKHNEQLIKLFQDYEVYTLKKKKVGFMNMDVDQFKNFISYLEDVCNYSSSHIKRLIKRLKFFISQAESTGIKVHQAYKRGYYVGDRNDEKIVDPYFSVDEINKIFNFDLSDNALLDNVRDNLIISCWTGLRISDFLRLNKDNIKDECIEILSTKKTGIGVKIPMHNQIKQILHKRNGELPLTLSDQKYNIYLKQLIKLIGISDVILGSKVAIVQDKKGENVRRKIVGHYPKYELITSHIGRRSFATNFYGKVDNNVIMVTGGWTTEAVMLSYIKKVKNDYTEDLKKAFDNL